MKFKTDSDREFFIQELVTEGILDEDQDSSDSLSSPKVKNFLRRRKTSVIKLKDFRKSQLTKQAWRAGRYRFLKGIR